MDPARRCTGKSKQSQERCKRYAIRGGRVCTMHGGAIPLVKMQAEQRLLLMVDPVLTELYRIALKGETDSVRIQAGKDLLDRAGLKPTEKVEADATLTITVVREEQPISIEIPNRALSNGHDTDH